MSTINKYTVITPLITEEQVEAKLPSPFVTVFASQLRFLSLCPVLPYQKAGFFVNADFYSDFPSFDSGTSVVYWKITEKSKQICFSIILQYYRF